MSETGILITYVSVAFLLLAVIFVYTAFAKANHENENEGIIIVFVIGSLFWPIMLPLSLVGLCVTLVMIGTTFANDALATYIRRKSKDK
jgi:formate hydrogenlyase subunit 3/multisubunit Na+/H+ antiporter MnhD subunit